MLACPSFSYKYYLKSLNGYLGVVWLLEIAFLLAQSSKFFELDNVSSISYERVYVYISNKCFLESFLIFFC